MHLHGYRFLKIANNSGKTLFSVSTTNIVYIKLLKLPPVCPYIKNKANIKKLYIFQVMLITFIDIVTCILK